MPRIHPAIIWEIERRERERRERKSEESRRLPLYVPVPPAAPPARKDNGGDVDFVIEF